MNWVRAIAGVLVLSSVPAWGTTLTWKANTEPDLAGYRIYQCSQQPCTRSSGTASLLTTLGMVTSFNIGTPAVIQYYFITAYDFANNESAESRLVAFRPVGAPPTVVPPVIGASPTSLAFVATQDGANPATQTVSVSNQGGGTLNWTVDVNVPWLTFSRVSGAGNETVTLTATTGTLTVGSYHATVTMNAAGASPVTVPVSLTITAAAPTPVPPPTTLSVPPTPGGLQILATQ